MRHTLVTYTLDGRPVRDAIFEGELHGQALLSAVSARHPRAKELTVRSSSAARSTLSLYCEAAGVSGGTIHGAASEFAGLSSQDRAARFERMQELLGADTLLDPENMRPFRWATYGNEKP